MVGEEVKTARVDNSFKKFGFEREERNRVIAGGDIDLASQLIFNYNEKNMDFGIRHIWIWIFLSARCD